MTLFVTDGDQRPTLAVVRSLGRAGVRVTVGCEADVCLAGRSRYCGSIVHYPSPLKEPEAFKMFIRQEITGDTYRVLLPMTDVTMYLIGNMQTQVDSRVHLPIPGADKIAFIQDKQRVLTLARQLGIECPRDFAPSKAESVEDFAYRLPYPVVIKPRFSRFLNGGKWAQGPVCFAHDANDFIRKYNTSHSHIPYPIVQEKVEGDGLGVFLLLWDGKPRAAFCHRRLREKPPWGGVSVLSESVPPDENLVQKSLKLLKTIGWQGVAMVEYKTDKMDGRPKLMEINGRFWGSLQLAIDSGVDFPKMLYKLAIGGHLDEPGNYAAGIKCRWLLGDLDHLLIRLTHSDKANHLPSNSPSRLGACINFLRFFEKGMRSEVWRRDDPSPGWFEYRSYFHENVQRIFRGQK